MKLLVVLGVFSILCPQIVNSAPFSEKEKKEIIEYFNRFRNNFAKDVPVANMNEIVYDDSLENKYPICEHALKLQKQDWRVELLSKSKLNDHKDSSTVHPDSSGIYEPGEAAHLAKGGNMKIREQIWFLNPSYTGLACYYFEKPCPVKGSNTDIWNGICIFGGSENVPPMSKLIKGEPGSKCPNGKSEKWQNLCATSVSSTISYIGSVLFFAILMCYY